MGLRQYINRIMENKSQQSVNLADPAALNMLFGSPSSASGALVTPETALRCPAVFACVKVIAESVAQLPLVLYKRSADGGNGGLDQVGIPCWLVMLDQEGDAGLAFQARFEGAADDHVLMAIGHTIKQGGKTTDPAGSVWSGKRADCFGLDHGATPASVGIEASAEAVLSGRM